MNKPETETLLVDHGWIQTTLGWAAPHPNSHISVTHDTLTELAKSPDERREKNLRAAIVGYGNR